MVIKHTKRYSVSSIIKRSVSQKHSEISFYTNQDGYNNKKKRPRIANIGKDLKKLETSYIVYGMRKSCS